MSWLHQTQLDSDRRLEQTGLPRRLLRHLILSHETLVGSQVLDAGCGSGELVRFLDRLGLEAFGLDESPEAVATARAAAPHLGFYEARIDETIPWAAQRFDLVLVRNLAVHGGSLFSLAALRATANLLACARPGGHLVFLARLAGDSHAGIAGHSESCYARHLACFPGERHTTGFPDGLVAAVALTWFLGGRLRSGYVTASLRVPAQPLARADWLRLAEHAAAAHGEPCCSGL